MTAAPGWLPRTYAALLDTGTPAAEAEAARIRTRMQDPTAPPPPLAVVARERAALASVLPLSADTSPADLAVLRLAATGLLITATLYGDPAAGRVGRIVGELERPDYRVPATYHHGGGLLDAAATLVAHLNNLGAGLADMLDAVAADTYSDAVYGNGRRRDNPDGYDELRSAELAHAHALALGVPAERADRIHRAVLGTAFDEVTKTQAGWADPDPVVQAVVGVDLHVLSTPGSVAATIDLAIEDGFSARWSPERVIGRAAADLGVAVRTTAEGCAFIDAHGGWWPEIDGRNAETMVADMFTDRIIGNADFVAGYQYPPTWTLDNPEQRAINAETTRALGVAVRDGTITATAAYQRARRGARPAPERT